MPITVITGYNRLLLTEKVGKLNDEQMRFCNQSIKSCQRLNNFIANLLAAFERYAFRGNIRQLENMIKRIIVLGSEASILEEVLGGGMTGSGGATATDSGALEGILNRAEASAGTVPLKEVGRQISKG